MFFVWRCMCVLGWKSRAKSIKKSLKREIFWCPEEDSNFHCLRQHAPEACASTNFAIGAFIENLYNLYFFISQETYLNIRTNPTTNIRRV